ncbi:MAG: hypothetical protein ACO3L6_08820, partial [Dehalococcoidia bacterium]
MPNELIIQKSHRFIYDHLYLASGARFAEVGSPDGCDLHQVEQAITDKTVGIVHLESPFKNRGIVPLSQLSKLA